MDGVYIIIALLVIMRSMMCESIMINDAIASLFFINERKYKENIFGLIL